LRAKAGEQGDVSHMGEDPFSKIGEVDLEIKLRIDVTKLDINRLFKQIDEIKNRDIRFHGSFALAFMGSAFIAVFYGILYIYSPLDIGIIALISFCLLLIMLACVYLNFRKTACAKGKSDAQQMATAYEEIKFKRRHLRNLNKTY
jgi:ABC-type transport system involved in cytochrome bd biosynthesis fused ATPase/permease subunit